MLLTNTFAVPHAATEPLPLWLFINGRSPTAYRQHTQGAAWTYSTTLSTYDAPAARAHGGVDGHVLVTAELRFSSPPCG